MAALTPPLTPGNPWGCAMPFSFSFTKCEAPSASGGPCDALLRLIHGHHCLQQSVCPSPHGFHRPTQHVVVVILVLDAKAAFGRSQYTISAIASSFTSLL